MVNNSNSYIVKFKELQSLGNTEINKYITVVINNIESNDRKGQSSSNLYENYYKNLYEKLVDICLKG